MIVCGSDLAAGWGCRPGQRHGGMLRSCGIFDFEACSMSAFRVVVSCRESRLSYDVSQEYDGSGFESQVLLN